MWHIVPHILWLSISKSLQLCKLSDPIGHQLWRYFIPWEYRGSNLSVLHISIVLSLSLRPPLCTNICTWSTLVFKILDQTILLTLLWAWVCPPHPYTCHKFFVSYPLMGTILIQKPKSTMPQPRKHHLSTENPMMSVSHTIRSCPHISGGNLLTQKIPHSALHGLHHPRTPIHDPPLDPTP